MTTSLKVRRIPRPVIARLARVSSHLFVAIAVAVAALSVGGSDVSAANGCGPGGTDWRAQIKSRLVVDAPFSFDFNGSCNTHDRCYGTPWNRVAFSYAAAKDACDRQFYSNLTRMCYVNYSRSNLAWQWCQYTAYGYYQAVNRWGDSAYRSAQSRR